MSSSTAVQVQLEIGHRAIPKHKADANGHTHDWTVYVRGVDNSNIQHFVEKVVFNLHSSFPKPKRVIKEPPYEVNESCWASFLLPIEVYFRNKEEPKIISFEHDMVIDLERPVVKTNREKLTFNNPSVDFMKKLLKGGGLKTSDQANSPSGQESHHHASLSSTTSAIDNSPSSKSDKSTSSSASRREKSLITSVSSAIPLEPLKGSSKLGISQQLPQLSHSPNLGSNTQELQQQPGSTTVASGGVRCERKVTNSSSSSSTALGGDPSTNTTTIQHSLTPDSQFTNLFGTPIHTRPNSQPSEQQSTASPATPTNGSNGGNGHRNDSHPKAKSNTTTTSSSSSSSKKSATTSRKESSNHHQHNQISNAKSVLLTSTGIVGSSVAHRNQQQQQHKNTVVQHSSKHSKHSSKSTTTLSGVCVAKDGSKSAAKSRKNLAENSDSDESENEDYESSRKRKGRTKSAAEVSDSDVRKKKRKESSSSRSKSSTSNSSSSQSSVKVKESTKHKSKAKSDKKEKRKKKIDSDVEESDSSDEDDGYSPAGLFVKPKNKRRRHDEAIAGPGPKQSPLPPSEYLYQGSKTTTAGAYFKASSPGMANPISLHKQAKQKVEGGHFPTLLNAKQQPSPYGPRPYSPNVASSPLSATASPSKMISKCMPATSASHLNEENTGSGNGLLSKKENNSSSKKLSKISKDMLNNSSGTETSQMVSTKIKYRDDKSVTTIEFKSINKEKTWDKCNEIKKMKTTKESSKSSSSSTKHQANGGGGTKSTGKESEEQNLKKSASTSSLSANLAKSSKRSSSTAGASKRQSNDWKCQVPPEASSPSVKKKSKKHRSASPSKMLPPPVYSKSATSGHELSTLKQGGNKSRDYQQRNKMANKSKPTDHDSELDDDEEDKMSTVSAFSSASTSSSASSSSSSSSVSSSSSTSSRSSSASSIRQRSKKSSSSCSQKRVVTEKKKEYSKNEKTFTSSSSKQNKRKDSKQQHRSKGSNEKRKSHSDSDSSDSEDDCSGSSDSDDSHKVVAASAAAAHSDSDHEKKAKVDVMSGSDMDIDSDYNKHTVIETKKSSDIRYPPYKSVVAKNGMFSGQSLLASDQRSFKQSPKSARILKKKSSNHKSGFTGLSDSDSSNDEVDHQRIVNSRPNVPKKSESSEFEFSDCDKNGSSNKGHSPSLLHHQATASHLMRGQLGGGHRSRSPFNLAGTCYDRSRSTSLSPMLHHEPPPLAELRDLQVKLATTNNGELLQRIVDLIEDRNRRCLKIINNCLQFDLLSLDHATLLDIKRIVSISGGEL